MKGAAWWPLLLVLGMAIGAWPGRRETDRYRREIEELKAQLRQRPRDLGTLGQLTRLVRLPESPSLPEAAGTTTGAPPSARAEAPTNRPSGWRRTPLSGIRPRAGDKRTMRERIDAAAEAWRVRAEIARNEFVSRARFDAAEAANFDVLVQAMNLRLRDRMAAFAQAVEAGQGVTPEAGARLIRDLSAAVVITYDELDRTLPRWRSPEAGALDLGNFIDPSVAEPLISVEDALRRADAELAR